MGFSPSGQRYLYEALGIPMLLPLSLGDWLVSGFFLVNGHYFGVFVVVFGVKNVWGFCGVDSSGQTSICLLSAFLGFMEGFCRFLENRSVGSRSL